MTIPVDKTQSEEPRPDAYSAPANESQASLACLTTYAPGVMLFNQYLYGQLGMLGQRLYDLERQSDRLTGIVEQQYRRYDEHMAILAACQRDTSSVLGHELERRALHPAIEAVVALVDELSHVQDCVRQVLDDTDGGAGGAGGSDGAGGGDKLRSEIAISCSIAQEKLAHLDVQRIMPAEGEALDVELHTVCGCVETVDEALHQRISSLVTPGIAYGGKVLRQARVIVFRLKS